MTKDPRRAPLSEVAPTLGEFAGIWSEVCLGSHNLHPSDDIVHPRYPDRIWWSAEGGFKVNAHTKGYKAVVGGKDHDELTGGRRAFGEYGLNVRMDGEVVVFVTRQYKVKGTIPLPPSHP